MSTPHDKVVITHYRRCPTCGDGVTVDVTHDEVALLGVVGPPGPSTAARFRRTIHWQCWRDRDHNGTWADYVNDRDAPL